jgi:hypothetical protein
MLTHPRLSICIGSSDGAMENAEMRSGQPRVLLLPCALCAGSAGLCKVERFYKRGINGKALKCSKCY